MRIHTNIGGSNFSTAIICVQPEYTLSANLDCIPFKCLLSSPLKGSSKIATLCCLSPGRHFGYSYPSRLLRYFLVCPFCCGLKFCLTVTIILHILVDWGFS
ncbi:hypothetical protein RF11_12941 [Thelohanellus kitauei]|uniref:Uncharacterized protein n=1 Tax=Thelohanellus kitauei TaxID=669202 RepID=A0A0C2J1S4_THEKT|nr:hypothetical protein RF11_12941 [Thelohanellus kitauei]